MVVQRVRRPTLDEMDLPIGKKTRLHRILYEHGPGHGVALILPIDQGLEHGPVDFFANPDSADPEFQLKLCVDGGYSAVAFHYGIAEKHMRPYAGQVPLILKLNGKTNIPSDAQAFSGLTGFVEDGVRLGADAVGYTLYVGSPRQTDDMRQLSEVRRACDACGMPLIVWAYPRGEAIDKKGGRDSPVRRGLRGAGRLRDGRRHREAERARVRREDAGGVAEALQYPPARAPRGRRARGAQRRPDARAVQRR